MSSVATDEKTRMMNETLFESLRVPGMEKKAIDAVNDFVRYRVREDGFLRKELPPIKIGNDELDRRLESDKPYKIVDREPDSPASVTVGFGTLPNNLVIRGPRFPVGFARIETPRFTKDVSELRTYIMDIRQILSDNSVKDILAEEDGKWTRAKTLALVGADQVVPQTGVVQWETIPGGISRDTFEDALAIMPKNPTHLEAATALVNNVTIREFMKWGRDELGGDMAQDVIKDGWKATRFGGVDLIITIKRNLVPDDRMEMTADPKFLGKFYTLEDVIMYLKREAFMLEFFAYEEIGCSIGNTGALARADFTS